MKRVWGNLLIAGVIISLLAILLRKHNVIQETASGRMNGHVGEVLLVCGTGILIGLMLQLPELIKTIKSRKKVRANWGLIIGQGLPATFLAINSIVVGWAENWDIFWRPLLWADKYTVELSLAGGIWLGVIFVQLLNNSSSMFHVKHRRKKL